MSIEFFITILFAVSLITSLVVEALKKLFNEAGMKYRPNLLAAITAVVLSVAVYVAYVIYIGITFTAKEAVFLIALMVASWLCSMLGYDKVVQTIIQIGAHKNKG